MARKPIKKELSNSRLLKDYASWIYCAECNKTVAYLCYVTYDLFEFEYTCNCGSCGSVFIEFDHDEPMKSDSELHLVKSRMCCPQDESPLFTLVEKNIKNVQIRIVCNGCKTEYRATVNR